MSWNESHIVDMRTQVGEGILASFTLSGCSVCGNYLDVERLEVGQAMAGVAIIPVVRAALNAAAGVVHLAIATAAAAAASP